MAKFVRDDVSTMFQGCGDGAVPVGIQQRSRAQAGEHQHDMTLMIEDRNRKCIDAGQRMFLRTRHAALTNVLQVGLPGGWLGGGQADAGDNGDVAIFTLQVVLGDGFRQPRCEHAAGGRMA